MRRIFPFVIILLLIGGCIFAEEQVSARRMAIRDLVRKADGGDAKALFDLARLHETGYDSIPQDSARSLGLYQLSAQKGYSPARNYIGFRYYKGENGELNLDSALYWILLAADVGDITAAANLGYLLTESEELPHNDEEARKWLKIAAEGGVPEAQIKFWEMTEDEWRNLPADSVLISGIDYYLGNAPILGTELIKIAAVQNNPRALALMGDAYSKGIGVPYDHQKSIDYFYSAAEAGDPSAQFIIAELLEIFPDIKPSIQDEEEAKDAAYWYKKASESGVTDSEDAYKKLYSLSHLLAR